MSKLTRDERLPLYQQVREELLEQISTGVWLPDTPIPTEAELTQRYGVAIGTLRKAMDSLVNEGLLYRYQGRGTFVRRPDFNASLFRFFRQSTGNDGIPKIPESTLLVCCTKTPTKAIRQTLQLNNNEECVYLERIRKLDNKVILSEQIWLPKSKFANLLTLELDDFGSLLYPFYEIQCSQLVASAQETLTIGSADKKTAEIMNISEGDSIAIIERVAYSYNKTPLEYRLSNGSAETFRYQIEIT